MRIKNIIFDVDDVLTNTIRQYIEYCCKAGIPTNLRHIPQRGIIDFNYKSDEHTDIYYNTPAWRPDAGEVVKKLHDRGIKLFALSRGNNTHNRKFDMMHKKFGDIIMLNLVPKTSSKLPFLRKLIREQKLNPAETLLIDDSVEALRSGLRAGVHVARMMGEFTMPTPKNFAHIPHINSLSEIDKLCN